MRIGFGRERKAPLKLHNAHFKAAAAGIPAALSHFCAKTASAAAPGKDDTAGKPRSRFYAKTVSILTALVLSASAAAAGTGAALILPAVPVHAEETLSADAEARKAEDIQSNADSSWPQGPAVTAESAILMDASTGAILYAKNIDEELYPASTTKMMTCLIAAEKLDLNDTITFSGEAIHSVPADGSNVGMDVGESITVEQALYAIMVGSANEVAAAVAEKVAGSVSAFADLMNERAAELGCTHTHFVNANGLHDDNHYTTAHDLALIARAFFDNDTMLRIGNTPSYHFEATATQPDTFDISNKHALITGQVACAGIIGGKTGYTGHAGETLVTGCERGGMRLIAVVMKEDSPYQFTDTAALFEWGYANFTEADVKTNETRFQVKKSAFLSGGSDLLGNSSDILSLSDGAKVILPKDVSFDQLDCTVTYTGSGSAEEKAVNSYSDDPILRDDTEESTDAAESGTAGQASESAETGKKVASLTYRYGNTVVGSADLCLLDSAGNSADQSADTISSKASADTSGSNVSGSASSEAIESAASGESGNDPSLRGRMRAFIESVKEQLGGMVVVNDSGTILINIREILTLVAALSGILIVIIFIIAFIRSFSHPSSEKRKKEADPNEEYVRPYRLHYDRLDDKDYDGKF